MNIYGFDALLRVVTHMVCIYCAFQALSALRLDNIFRKNKIGQVRVLIVMLSIVIGYQTSSFLLEIVALFKNFIVVYIK